jgi:hypothetical protein
MMFLAPVAVPPVVLPGAVIDIPSLALPRAIARVTSVPIEFLGTWFPVAPMSLSQMP